MKSIHCISASVLATFVGAQTFSSCDPTKQDCPNNPAMPATFETDFTAGQNAITGWKQTAGSLNYVAGGAEFTVKKTGDAPTMQSDGYFLFGYVEVKMKAAPGAGIVSSVVLESDDLDEVDWEFIGSVSGKAQMNYFGKGNTTTYDRMIEANVDNAQELHTYALNWTADALTWIMDGQAVRTLNYADANNGNTYPQTPCNVRIGIWAGGDSDSQGTRTWAGGAVDYAQAPFTQLVQSVKVINYSPGSEYQWTDRSGSYKSIKVINPGQSAGASVNRQVIQPSATATGQGIASQINVPTATGVLASYPTNDAPCECGVVTVTVTGPPPGQTPTSISILPPVPSSSPVLATTKSAIIPSLSSTSALFLSSTSALFLSSTSALFPSPPVDSTCQSGTMTFTSTVTQKPPPYPTTLPGIMTDTVPASSMAYPTAPTGTVPTPSGTITTSPPLFTGAASMVGTGSALGLAGSVFAVLMAAL